MDEDMDEVMDNSLTSRLGHFPFFKARDSNWLQWKAAVRSVLSKNGVLDVLEQNLETEDAVIINNYLRRNLEPPLKKSATFLQTYSDMGGSPLSWFPILAKQMESTSPVVKERIASSLLKLIFKPENDTFDVFFLELDDLIGSISLHQLDVPDSLLVGLIADSVQDIDPAVDRFMSSAKHAIATGNQSFDSFLFRFIDIMSTFEFHTTFLHPLADVSVSRHGNDLVIIPPTDNRKTLCLTCGQIGHRFEKCTAPIDFAIDTTRIDCLFD